jgi:hypothetical protein
LQADQDELSRLRSQLAALNLRGRDRQDLEQREASLSQEITALRNCLAFAPSILTANGQAEAIAQPLGLDPSKISNGLVVLFATLLELASAYGIFLTSALFATEAKFRTLPKPSARVRPPILQSIDSDPSRRKSKGNILLLPSSRDANAIIHAWLNLQTRVREGGASDLNRTLTTYCNSRNLPVPSMKRLAETPIGSIRPRSS